MNAPTHHDDPFPASGHIALATLTAEVKGMKESLGDLRKEIREDRGAIVSRSEWEQRNRVVDERIANIVNDIASKRIPWTSIAAIVIAGAVLLFDLIPNLAN